MKFFALFALVATASAISFVIDPNETKDERDIRVNRETDAASKSGLANTAWKTPFEKDVIERAEIQHAAQPGAGMNRGVNLDILPTPVAL